MIISFSVTIRFFLIIAETALTAPLFDYQSSAVRAPFSLSKTNWWASYSQSLHTLVNTYVYGSKSILEYQGSGNLGAANPNGPGVKIPALAGPANYMSVARKYGNKMLYPTGLNSDQDNALSNCGNEIPQAIFKSFSDNGIKEGVYYPNGNQGVYYYTTQSNTAFYSVNAWKTFWPQ